MSGSPASWMGRLSLRARLMLVGLAGVATGLLASGLVLYGVLGASLDRSIEDSARRSAAEIATLVDEQRLPNPLPVSGAQLVQVVDASSRVVAASLTADRLTSLLGGAELSAALAGRALDVPGNRAGLTGTLRAVAVGAGPSSARMTVIAAVPTADLAASQQRLRAGLLVALPLLLALMAVIAWRVIGAALRPVEALRAGAERIGGGSEGSVGSGGSVGPVRSGSRSAGSVPPSPRRWATSSWVRMLARGLRSSCAASE
ncbi:MAG TPA: hypothetical protein VHM65_09605, partial [Candidatus Lustribacter sp.]|nr:hypothetical protein [Candidatus Lustribacter sp.]